MLNSREQLKISSHPAYSNGNGSFSTWRAGPKPSILSDRLIFTSIPEFSLYTMALLEEEPLRKFELIFDHPASVHQSKGKSGTCELAVGLGVTPLEEIPKAGEIYHDDQSKVTTFKKLNNLPEVNIPKRNHSSGREVVLFAP